ncbi:hypothetical protein N8T08_001207 [Aspergillus melleus]|uniref:Uncharacterized protein n=1 Tax=Aspergillus melleus TaxID=138277 RepID=A0ACC3ANQ0_9EURO|nr:hypothetical protein N8T08_001207 [Aspergillus melleus]
MPPDTIINAALDVGPFSPATKYESFGGYPDVSVSPLSYYGSQALSASPEYGVPMEITGHHDMIRSQSSGMWPNDVFDSFDRTCKIKEEHNECWDQGLLPTVTDVPTTSAVAPMPRTVTNDDISSDHQLAGSTSGTLIEVDPKDERLPKRGQKSVTQSHHPYEVILKWTKSRDETSNNEPSKIPSASGLECTTCGIRFTRRSNCREHMKKHDPSRRKMYHCETCERPFGRRTDLRRHVDSIHRGIRKFTCDLCDQKFSRQDTLTRHRPDCERRKRKAAKEAKCEKKTDPVPQSPLTTDLHEIKMERFTPEM